MLGKKKGKKRGQLEASGMDSVMVVMGASLEDQVEDR